jgi:hypothetical protein
MGIFRVKFTGLCAYAPDKELGDMGKPPTKMMVLMVNAMDQGLPLVALDKRRLREHFPVLMFNSDILLKQGVIPSASEVRWFFPGQELRIKVDETKATTFAVLQDKSDGDFNHGVHVKEIIAKSSSDFPLDLRCFKKPSKSVLAARVYIDAGKLLTHKLDKINFHLSDTLEGTFKSRPVSNVVALEFHNATAAHIHAYDLDNPGSPQTLDFDCSKPEVEIIIGNLCGESLGLAPVMPPGDPRKDKDFRWFYNLFDATPKLKIKKAVTGVSLPVPVPVSVPLGGGLQPVQCMRLNLHAQSF